MLVIDTENKFISTGFAKNWPKSRGGIPLTKATDQAIAELPGGDRRPKIPMSRAIFFIATRVCSPPGSYQRYGQFEIGTECKTRSHPDPLVTVLGDRIGASSSLWPVALLSWGARTR